MFGPMFLLPGQADAPGVPHNSITVNYYLNGQPIGGITCDISSDKGKQIIARPRCCHYASTGAGLGPAPIETGSANHPITHPIAGFDGWISTNDQPYEELILPATAGWTDATIDAPLVGPKGSFAVNRIHGNSTHVRGGIEIEVDGTIKGSVGTFFYSANRASYAGITTPTGYPWTGNILTWQQTSITGQYLTLTVEFK